MRPQSSIATGVACGVFLLASTEAEAGFIGGANLFINEDLTITVPAGFAIVSITKIINLVGDPPIVQTGDFVNTLPGNGGPSVVYSPGGCTPGTNCLTAAVTFPSTPVDTISGHQHIGFGVGSAGAAGRGTIVENPGIFQMFTTFVNLSTLATNVNAFPALNVNVNAVDNGNAPRFAIEFVDATQGGLTVGEWFEEPVNDIWTLSFENDMASGDLTLSDAGFFISPTQIPLDQLNAADLPPTDPRFQPIPGIPDGTVLAPGQASATLAVPEPPSAALLSLGVLALLGVRRRATRNVTA
jgi:hypothetical protein